MYQIVRNQWIMGGMDGIVVGLNYSAVISVLELYNVTDMRDSFEKIVYLSNMDVHKMSEERKKADAKTKK